MIRVTAKFPNLGLQGATLHSSSRVSRSTPFAENRTSSSSPDDLKKIAEAVKKHPSNRALKNYDAPNVGDTEDVPGFDSKRPNDHIEGVNWYKKKGALFVYSGNVTPPAGVEPEVVLYFQRFPTEYSYQIKPLVATQSIPGQTGTNIQKLGSESAVYQTQLLFHDAFISSEQVSTADGLAILSTILREGWKYKILWTMGEAPARAIVIRNMRVTMSHFVPAGHKKGGVLQMHVQTKTVDPVTHAQWARKNADDAQRAVVDLEFMEDLSKDVVVPFVNRRRKVSKKKKDPLKDCLRTPAPGAQLGLPAPTPPTLDAAPSLKIYPAAAGRRQRWDAISDKMDRNASRGRLGGYVD